MISVRQIAQALGGDVAGTSTVLCPGPGHSPRDRSLAVRLDPSAPDGFLCFSHCGDDWRDCRDHVRTRLRLPAWQPGDGRQRAIPQRRVIAWDMAATEADAADVPRAYDADQLGRIDYARGLWDEAEDPRGKLAEKYLRLRWLSLPSELCGTVLRFHPRCPWRDEATGKTERVPALLAPFRSVGKDDSIVGIHRIALNADGTKRGRRMLGVVARAAIKLDQINGEALAIGEGVETAMAARQIMRLESALPTMPVWALGSAGAISFFPLLDGISKLMILGENDDANARAVAICRKRWRDAGRRAPVTRPCPEFNDFNDVLAATIKEGIGL
jgi:putative DNA primase/helicase